MPDGKIPCGSTDTPATVVVSGLLVIFHQGWKHNGWLYYTTRKSDGTFTDDVGVPNTGLSFSPGVVLYRHEVYVFHQGRGDNRQLWFNKWRTSLDSGWAGDKFVADKCLARSPRAVVYQDKIYVFYESFESPGSLRYRIHDGSNMSGEFTVPNSKITESPSPVVVNGKIIVFYQGRDQDHDKVLHWNEFSGTEWSGDKSHPAWAWTREWISAPPCPVVVGDQVWLFYYSSKRVRGEMMVHFRIMGNDGNWDFYNRELGEVGWWGGSYRPTTMGPHVTLMNDTFYGFASASDGWLYYRTLDKNGVGTPFFSQTW